MSLFIKQLLRKKHFILLTTLIFYACRKDNSAFVNLQPAITEKCLVAKHMSSDGRTIKEATYDLDSVMTGIISKEEDQIVGSMFLVSETTAQFLNFRGSKNPEDAVSRVYLNENGSISKEVQVTLNDDGITYTEDPEHQMIFTYNVNNQLEKIESTFEDEGIYDLEYDEKNRIKKIVIHDGEGATYFVYDNFSYDDHVKQDNETPLVLFDSLTSYLIPSIRNVYIKGYTLSSPLDPLLGRTVEIDYKFTDNKLSELSTRLTAPDGTVSESTATLILNCK